jgi:alkylhydroperoxidase family enzyme
VELIAPSTAPLLTDQERAAQALCIALLMNHGHGAGNDLERYAEAYGAAAAVAVVFVVGRFAAHALFANALGFDPPVPSIIDGAGA